MSTAKDDPRRQAAIHGAELVRTAAWNLKYLAETAKIPLTKARRREVEDLEHAIVRGLSIMLACMKDASK